MSKTLDQMYEDNRTAHTRKIPLFRVWIHGSIIALDWATREEADQFKALYEAKNPAVKVEIQQLFSVSLRPCIKV